MPINQKRIKALIKSRARIIVSDALIRALDFDDVRDFTKSLGDWGYTTDFTYRDRLTDNFQAHIREYLRSFLDCEYVSEDSNECITHNANH